MLGAMLRRRATDPAGVPERDPKAPTVCAFPRIKKSLDSINGSKKVGFCTTTWRHFLSPWAGVRPNNLGLFNNLINFNKLCQLSAPAA